MVTGTKTAARDLAAEIACLTRALKAPSCESPRAVSPNEPAGNPGRMRNTWSACLQREVAARDAHGGEDRIRAARFPTRKSIEEFDFDRARRLKRDMVAHLATLDFVAGKENVIFLGAPGTGKTHLAIGLAIRGCQAGHRVLIATASQWVDKLADAHNSGRLQTELLRLSRYPLGYIPFEPEAANLFFQLASSRYERASLIVNLQQAVRPLGRSLRRRGRRRRHDRPPRPPRDQAVNFQLGGFQRRSQHLRQSGGCVVVASSCQERAGAASAVGQT
jgi:DNA replication protein DnaC